MRTGARGSSKVHMSAARPSTMSRAPLSGAAADGPSPARGTANAPGGGGGGAAFFGTQEEAGRWGRRILVPTVRGSDLLLDKSEAVGGSEFGHISRQKKLLDP